MDSNISWKQLWKFWIICTNMKLNTSKQKEVAWNYQDTDSINLCMMYLKVKLANFLSSQDKKKMVVLGHDKGNS